MAKRGLRPGDRVVHRRRGDLGVITRSEDGLYAVLWDDPVQNYDDHGFRLRWSGEMVAPAPDDAPPPPGPYPFPSGAL